MPFREIESNKKKIGIGFVVAFFVIWFLASFWNELGDVRQLFWNLLMLALRRPITPHSPQTLPSFLNLILNLFFGFGLVTLIWLYLVSSQALLPVRNSLESIRTAWHLIQHVQGSHGPATFIQNGKEQASAEEKKRAGRGVVVIDFNSAAVFEQLIGPPSLLLPLFRLQSAFLTHLGLIDRPETGGGPRVEGPGVVFTSGGERIRGTIDLRKQSRFANNVRAYTRDGIELSTGIWILFSVGHTTIRQVTYQGDRKAENLRPIATRRTKDGKIQIETLSSYELDEQDRNEIHNAVSRREERKPYKDIAEVFLPTFEKSRVFAAISSSARNSKNELTPWDMLPLQVATGIFQELLPLFDYNDLYQPDKDTGKYPLPQIKERFNNLVRNQGVLSYRLVSRWDDDKDNVYLYDGTYPSETLCITEPAYIPGSKLLRERGIEVIACGFLDIKPVSDEVKRQRLESWKASWEWPRKYYKALQDVEINRVQNTGRLEAERIHIQNLDELLKQSQHPEEVLAAFLFNRVEIMKNEPKSQQMLTADTIKTLDTIHNWLLPDRLGKGRL